MRGVNRAVSVVLPCYNRAEYLTHWLAAFAWWAPEHSDDEIIVVDDGGADHCEAVVDRWRERGLDVRYLRLRGPAAPRNNAQARNAGIRAARHPLVLNSDPDVVFVADVLGLLRDAWRPGTFCTLTRYQPLTQNATRELWRAAESRPLRPEDFLAHAAGRQNLVHRPDGVFGLHGAFLCDRDTLLAVRGYDERFHHWGWEDRDLLTRLEIGVGMARQQVAGASVVHQWHPTIRPDETADRASYRWRMGWQQARALTPGPIERNADGWGDRLTTPPEPTPERVSREDWPLFVDIGCLEAQASRREGDAAAAAERLRHTLSCSWEYLATDVTPDPSLSWQLAHALEQYPNAAKAATDYVAALRASGDEKSADTVLRALIALTGDTPATKRIRAARLADTGRLEAAVALLEECLAAELRAEDAARLTELLVRRGLPARATQMLAELLAAPGARLDTFDRLLLEGYLAQLSAPEAGHAWPPRVHGESAGEYLFSVAMRARRDGCVLGAMAMFDAYLALEMGSEPELRERAAAMRDEMRGQWTTLVEAPAPAVRVAPDTVSVIICTHGDRHEPLERLIAALRDQTVAFELVIVLGPAGTATRTLVENLPPDVIRVACDELNISRARNIGIAASGGRIVAFIDDDAIPGSPTWLETLIAPLAGTPDRSPGVAAVGSAVHRGNTDVIEFAGGATSVTGFQRFADETAPATAPDGTRWITRIPGGNCAIRRDALDAVGGFDEQFVYYLDETDLCVRLVAAGYEIAYTPDAPIDHFPAPSAHGRAGFRDRYPVARSDAYFVMRHAPGRALQRVWRTVREHGSKHFVREGRALFDRGDLTRAGLVRSRLHCWRGLASGLWAALVQGPELAAQPPIARTRAFRPFTPRRVLVLDPHVGLTRDRGAHHALLDWTLALDRATFHGAVTLMSDWGTEGRPLVRVSPDVVSTEMDTLALPRTASAAREAFVWLSRLRALPQHESPDVLVWPGAADIAAPLAAGFGGPVVIVEIDAAEPSLMQVARSLSDGSPRAKRDHDRERPAVAAALVARALTEALTSEPGAIDPEAAVAVLRCCMRDGLVIEGVALGSALRGRLHDERLALEALYHLAGLSAHRGDESAALEWYESIYQHPNRAPEAAAFRAGACFRLARAAQAAGLEQRAERLAHECLALIPDHGAARALLESLHATT